MLSRFAVMLVFCVFVGSSLAGEDKYSDLDLKIIYQSDWNNFLTEHLNIIANTDDETTRLIASELEQFGQFVSYLLRFTPSFNKEPLDFVIAKDKRSYQAFAIPKYSGGLFLQSDMPFAMAYAKKFRSAKGGKHSWGRAIVFHELVHFLSSNSEFEFAQPPWFREGIAEYLATFRITDQGVELGDMKTLGDRAYGMRGKRNRMKRPNVEALFKANDVYIGEPTEEARSYFYGYSAYIVHYLFSTPELRNKMWAYLFALKQGYSEDVAFQGLFKMSWSEFDKQVYKYATGKYVKTIIYPIREGAVQFKPVSIQKVETDSLILKNRLLNTVFEREDWNGIDRADVISELKAAYPDWYTALVESSASQTSSETY